MENITKLSPAKINLYLEIQEKTHNGYHNLESLMTLCNFGDVIEVKLAESFNFKMNGPFSSKLSKSSNIIIKAINLLEKKYEQKFAVEINLTKNLPIASGMGGGSSNAATTILCIAELFKLNLTKKFLNYLFFLGADVPFCFFRKTAIVRGKGEKVFPLKKKIPEFFLLLVNPMKEISTKLIFENLKIQPRQQSNFDENLLQEESFIKFLKSKSNHLQTEAIIQCPDIKLILDFLDNKTNTLLSRLTGSGATCFALYDYKEDLDKAYDLVTERFEDFWVKKTKIDNYFE
tara:strand:- start:5344 stop:6210 length:867 start_codon:yes stop_codon:yes gene_type:complete